MSVDLVALKQVVQAAYDKHHAAPGGENASYIPYLANVPSDLSALAVVTVDGDIITAGDADFRFAIESISKVCTLALALDDIGPDAVQEKIGANPTGLPFNSVMALELHHDKPLSPLVNAGAMATVSVVEATSVEDRWRRILDMQSKLAGAKVELSNDVNQSEQATNFHNRAIAWLLYSADAMYCDPMEACDVYTRQCSTLISTVQLATMGATLAGNGLNPITKVRALAVEHTRFVLAEMTMEGMYGSSGDWAYTVGLPAKSGVGGGILTVVPGVMGIAAFSPPLDETGNSIRGQLMAAAVAQAMGYNLYAG